MAVATGLVMWDLWWTKWRWGRFYQSTSVSPANLYSTNFSTITITCHPGLVQNWPVVAAVPKVPPHKLKKNISRWLHTAANRVQTRVYSSDICRREIGDGADILRVFRFPLPIFIPPISPQSLIIWGWYNRPVVAAVNKVPPQKLKKYIY
jgi:hypothetical protein